MDTAIDAILTKAEELGRLIRDTTIYRNYIAQSEQLNADGDAVKLFEEYMALSRSIKERQDMADIIERYEFDNLEHLAGLVSESDAIMNFLKAQQEYLELLTRIQKELSDAGFQEE